MTELERLMNTSDNIDKEQIAVNNERTNFINTRLIEIEAHTAEPRAAKILSGLGFSQEDIYRNSDEFSGGWRMRISLAKALFSNPDLLLLDEPTNHLDLDAVMWLEDYVKSLEITVVIVSHAREFLNNVSEEILHFVNGKIEYYKGDYHMFEKV